MKRIIDFVCFVHKSITINEYIYENKYITITRYLYSPELLNFNFNRPEQTQKGNIKTRFGPFRARCVNV